MNTFKEDDEDLSDKILELVYSTFGALSFTIRIWTIFDVKQIGNRLGVKLDNEESKQILHDLSQCDDYSEDMVKFLIKERSGK